MCESKASKVSSLNHTRYLPGVTGLSFKLIYDPFSPLLYNRICSFSVLIYEVSIYYLLTHQIGHQIPSEPTEVVLGECAQSGNLILYDPLPASGR